jgi:hypothetical protein
MGERPRFVDDRESVHDFTDEILVVCPACGGCARVLPVQSEAPGRAPGRRLVCRCGHIRETAPGSIRLAAGQDGYFGLPLWLSAPCCGETLWAFNQPHLDFLERYVGATLRESVRDSDFGWSNQSLASRLPGWVKDAKNRPKILRAIRRLRERRLPPDAGGNGD